VAKKKPRRDGRSPALGTGGPDLAEGDPDTEGVEHRHVVDPVHAVTGQQHVERTFARDDDLCAQADGRAAAVSKAAISGAGCVGADDVIEVRPTATMGPTSSPKP